MDISVENTGDLSRKMQITVPAADIETLANERLEYLQKTVKMAGFRAGKVPMDVVKKNHGAQVLSEITESVISNSLAKAFTEKDIRPAGQPHMGPEAGLPELGKDYTFTVTFEIYPEVTLPDFSKIKVTKEMAKPDEKMVNDLLDRLAGSRMSFSEKKGAAADGDRVIIDAEGFVGEDAFEGGNLKSFQVVLGAGQMIPGFEDGLKDKKAGDKFDLTVTFPAEYHSKDLAGKDAVFKTEVLRVEASEKPEFNDDFAKGFGEETMDGLKKRIEEQLTTDLEAASTQKMKRELFDAMEKGHEFNVPEGMIESEFNAIWQSQMQDLAMRGMKMEDMDKSEDELKAEFKELAARRVRLGLVLSETGQKNDIRIEKADIDAEIEKVAAANPDQADQVRAHYADPQRQNEIVGPLFEQKVTEFILSQAKVTEKEVKAEELVKEFA